MINLNEKEYEYKKRLLELLNKYKSGWIDGDAENQHEQTADLVNNSLKIVIEIKDDTKYKYVPPPPTGEMIVRTMYLPTKQNQLKKDAREANRKFRNYKNYKTILLIRTELIYKNELIAYLINGLIRYTK